MRAANIVALILLIVGGLNWGLVGLFQFDLVAAIFGGQGSAIARIVYVLVGIAALYGFRAVPQRQRGPHGLIAPHRGCPRRAAPNSIHTSLPFGYSPPRPLTWRPCR